jgi:hypothetical protein
VGQSRAPRNVTQLLVREESDVSEVTYLEPLSVERAGELFELLHASGPDSALALDAEGRVLGVVPADEPNARHLLGDLDVHA